MYEEFTFDLQVKALALYKEGMNSREVAECMEKEFGCNLREVVAFIEEIGEKQN